MTGARILFLDIETRPAIVATFGIRDQHINHGQILQDGGTICVGLGWFHEQKVRVLSDWEHGHSEMIRQVHAAISEADAVATFNGTRFDLPKLRGDYLLEGLLDPPEPTQIDLFKAIKKMGFICNKLDYIAPRLGIGTKVKHEGLPLWLKVMEGCPKAQARMARYCAGDVKLTKDLYRKLLPYITDHPHLGDASRYACGACGSSHLQSRGVRRTKASFIARLQCQKCGSWQSGKRSAA
jgi:ribosomal protein S27AE